MYRLIVDSGIKCGAGTDGSNFAPNNPWLNIYYMTTGVNVRGIPGERRARRSRGSKSLRMWTAGSAYQNFDDDKGVFEVGQGRGHRRAERQLRSPARTPSCGK